MATTGYLLYHVSVIRADRRGRPSECANFIHSRGGQKTYDSPCCTLYASLLQPRIRVVDLLQITVSQAQSVLVKLTWEALMSDPLRRRLWLSYSAASTTKLLRGGTGPLKSLPFFSECLFKIILWHPPQKKNKKILQSENLIMCSPRPMSQICPKYFRQRRQLTNDVVPDFVSVAFEICLATNDDH